MESKKRDKESRSQFFTPAYNKSYFINLYKVAVISLAFSALLVMLIINLPAATADTGELTTNVQETSGILTISQEGTAKLMKPAAGLAAEHMVSLSISGNYAFSSSEGLKIDAGSLSGTLTVDNGQPIELSIQKIGTYKNLKALFYRATFVEEVGTISGKLKFKSPLNFESDSTQTTNEGTITAKIDSARYYSKATTGDISLSGIALTKCDQSLWEHVYHPNRLEVVDPCKTVSGVIEAKISEKDGDYHIRLKLDSQYAGLINSVNIEKQHGDLVVEPICQHKVTQTDAISACEGFSKQIDIPPVGTHVRVTGSYVLDHEHGGWAEIHPVTSMERLDL